MRIVLDRVVLAFLGVGVAMAVVGLVGGRPWFGPGWLVFLLMGLGFIGAGLAMAYTGPKDPPR